MAPPHHLTLTIKLVAGFQVSRSLLSARNRRKEPNRLASYQLALVLWEFCRQLVCRQQYLSARALSILNRNGIPGAGTVQLFNFGKCSLPNSTDFFKKCPHFKKVLEPRNQVSQVFQGLFSCCEHYVNYVSCSHIVSTMSTM